ncbi:exodeoxyribonuclease V subunit gamma [Rhabdochromatium marinum]|uniref:exodeoxyribonuclease V subunit gamma n=1 Tax=Rhabdochromatium marinum TaxID=48729 RepID=UPI001903C4A8|nr:exodeoxyribonuclease V subunit gamma [Rhabdochromatium marinum]MBK1648159.1 exodeoxyribonuclease V subunit gamma [Rhabdochromatium marinum]
MNTTAELQPGFMLIQGNCLEALSDVMTAWVQAYPLRPLENEVILVQSNGIGQWLKLALAAPLEPGGQGGWGIAAAVKLMLPASFVWQSYRAVLGHLPHASAYDKAPLTWRLYRLLGDLDALAEGPEQNSWLAALRGFLRTDRDPRRRHQLAERLADLFDQYQVYRADWLEAWARGEDVLIRPDGNREALPAWQRWQPLLWRRLQQDCRADSPVSASAVAAKSPLVGESSRAEIHQRFLQAATVLPKQGRPPTLPRRVIVFGVSALPRQIIEVLHAISSVSQVMLFVHNPCRHYWGDIIEGRELFRTAYRRDKARKVPEDVDENTLHLHGHPLLAAWGKQGRDYIRLLDALDQRDTYEAAFSKHDLSIDLFEDTDSPATLLQQVQDDILELRPLEERRAFQTQIDPDKDQSVRFLMAHGPQREVEILHDQLLAAFAAADAAGQPLAPRDILVMVPDIETYTPHVEAVFGRLARNDRRFIPFSLSDQGPRQHSPLLLGFERLLQLPQARCTVTEVLDLLDIPALRARFGLDEADLPALRHWITGARVRWGLDAEHREHGFHLPAKLQQNTWHFGLERMLLGVASGTSAAWQGVEPYDEVAGLDAALIGPLAELLERLSHSWQLLQVSRTPMQWSETLTTLLDDFFCPVGDADEQHLTQVRDQLEQWTFDCARGGLIDECLPLEVVRVPLLAGLDEPSLSRRFLAGAVNFATLMPMRAVPFRQIWLLGMNDGDYPRMRRQADFDLMVGDYRPGDRSRREDDRYLFLEALLSARERLVISWVGRSLRDNSERPPSVLVSQLRDHIAAGWRLASAGTPAGQDGQQLLQALSTEHPLQPFSRQYFLPPSDPQHNSGLFTYAREWSQLTAPDAARAASPPALAPPQLEAPIRCADLGRFLRYPLKTFYSQRLGVHLGQDVEQSDDEEPFDLDGLGRWALYDAILQDCIRRLAAPGQAEVSAAALLNQAIQRRAGAGELPLPPFDELWKAQLHETLEPPLACYQALLRDYPQRLGSAATPADQRLRLTLDQLVLEDNPDAFTSPIRVNAKHERLRLVLQASQLDDGNQAGQSKVYNLVRHWPAHLAAQHQGPTHTRLLGPLSDIELPPMDWKDARAHLLTLLHIYGQGLTEPLPLACKTALAFLRTAANSKAKPSARIAYEGDGYQLSGENSEHPGYQRFWPSYDDLVADQRFTTLATQLYQPLLD